MPTQKKGRYFCDAVKQDGQPCGGMMRYRRRTNDYACTMCPCTVPLSDLTPLQEPEKVPI